MITGKVTANREIVVEIDVAGPAHQFQRTQAVIDTGYNGQLTLSQQLIRALQLPFAGHRRATLADGSTILLDVFVAEVLWQSTRQDVIVSQAAGAPLVGMSLLWGCRVSFDAFDGGTIQIETLPPGVP